MIVRPVRAVLTDQQASLWSRFLDCYCATSTRGVVDRFLRAIIGAPRG